jgi:hypothetical protein
MPNHTIQSTAVAFGNALHAKYSCSVERDDPEEHDDGHLGPLLSPHVAGQQVPHRSERRKPCLDPLKSRDSACDDPEPKWHNDVRRDSEGA